MALQQDIIKKWAAGKSANSEEADEEIDMDGSEDKAPNEPVWAGEEEEDIDEAKADACLEWLADNEPEVSDALLELGKAIVEEDDRMIQHAEDELKTVKQYLTPEYPEFDKEQREALPEALRASLSAKPDAESPEFKVGLVSGLQEVRASDGDSEDADEDEDEDLDAESDDAAEMVED